MKNIPLAIVPKPKKIKPLEYHERMMLKYSSFAWYAKKKKMLND